MATRPPAQDSIDVGSLMPVLVGMLLVGLPLYAQLSWLVLWFMLVFAGWSLLVVRGRLKPPPSWMRIVLALLVVLVLYVSYDAVFGLIPGTSMVILLSYLKLFEMRGKRDVTVIIFIGYFLASSSFFHSQSIWVAVYVFVIAIYLTSLLVMIADRNNSTGWRERIRISARMVLQSVPLMLILFLLFPRIPGPLWGLPKDALSASTGLSQEMTPGNINNLVASYDVAFRVKFDSPPPQNRYLYWRGLVLSDYDGKTWRREDAPGWTEPDVLKTANVKDELSYEITLEPHQQNWLYTLETVTAFDSVYMITRELQLFKKKGRVNNIMRYSLASSLHATNRALYPPERRKNLELPVGFNPRTLALGEQLRRQAGGDSNAIVNAVLKLFSEQDFYYTLSPPLLGDNAMDDFLFDSRRGFCEHYASAFVTLVRAAGIPARVVLGYQGGELNPIDGYLVVRQSDAHAWTEVWVDDDHWLRVDPTNAVAPERIERGIQNAGLEARLLPRMFMLDNAFIHRLRFAWDSVQNGWNQWVVGFDDNRQMSLFRKLGFGNIDKSDLVLWLVVAMSTAGLAVAWWVVRTGRDGHSDRVRNYYDRFRRKLARRGVAIVAQDTSQELLEKIRRSLPRHFGEAGAIIKAYRELVYGMSRNRENEARFIRAVRKFRA